MTILVCNDMKCQDSFDGSCCSMFSKVFGLNPFSRENTLPIVVQYFGLASFFPFQVLLGCVPDETLLDMSVK